MKYILIPSLLVLSMAAHSTMPKTDGAYLGLGAVYTKPTNHLSVATINLGTGGQDSHTVKTSTKSTIIGRLLGGYYTKYSNNVFLQAELFGQLADPKQKTQPMDAINAREKFDLKVKRNWTAGAALKLGYYFNDVFGAFLSVGPLYSQFKTTASSLDPNLFPDYTPARSASQTQKVWGGSIGGGLVYQATDSILLKAEYAYEKYKRFKTRPLQSYFIVDRSNINNMVTSKVHYNTFVVSASYLF